MCLMQSACRENAERNVEWAVETNGIHSCQHASLSLSLSLSLSHPLSLLSHTLFSLSLSLSLTSLSHSLSLPSLTLSLSLSLSVSQSVRSSVLSYRKLSSFIVFFLAWTVYAYRALEYMCRYASIHSKLQGLAPV